MTIRELCDLIKQQEGIKERVLAFSEELDFSPKVVDKSLGMAEEFLRIHYPEMLDCDFTCDSWLLSKQLEGLFSQGFSIW